MTRMKKNCPCAAGRPTAIKAKRLRLAPTMGTRRFDTRFFVAQAPADQTALHDNEETTDSVWLAPRAALEQYRDGRIDLAPPQIMSLAHLARHASVASVLDAKGEPLASPALYHTVRGQPRIQSALARSAVTVELHNRTMVRLGLYAAQRTQTLSR